MIDFESEEFELQMEALTRRIMIAVEQEVARERQLRWALPIVFAVIGTIIHFWTVFI